MELDGTGMVYKKAGDPGVGLFDHVVQEPGQIQAGPCHAQNVIIVPDQDVNP